MSDYQGGSRIQSSLPREGDTDLWGPNPVSRLLEFGYWRQETGYRRRDTGYYTGKCSNLDTGLGPPQHRFTVHWSAALDPGTTLIIHHKYYRFAAAPKPRQSSKEHSTRSPKPPKTLPQCCPEKKNGERNVQTDAENRVCVLKLY